MIKPKSKSFNFSMKENKKKTKNWKKKRHQKKSLSKNLNFFFEKSEKS